MKKYLLMILAVVSMVFSSVALTSCGTDDDKASDMSYTMSYYISPGNMSQAEYELVKEKVKTYDKTVEFTSEAVAIIAFDIQNSQDDSMMKKMLKDMAEDGYKNITITCYLKNSKGEEIKRKVWYQE